MVIWASKLRGLFACSAPLANATQFDNFNGKTRQVQYSGSEFDLYLTCMFLFQVLIPFGAKSSIFDLSIQFDPFSRGDHYSHAPACVLCRMRAQDIILHGTDYPCCEVFV